MGGSPNEEPDTHAISMLTPIDRPEEYALTDPWADQFGSSICPCGGRLFHLCVFPSNLCTTRYECMGGDPHCREKTEIGEEWCLCAQQNKLQKKWPGGSRFKCLTSYAEKAAKARETLAPGPPRDRLKAFGARCLSRAIAANDDAWAAKYDTPVDH